MDDTDGDRADRSPLGDELVPAIRRVGDDRDSTRAVPDVEALTGEPQVLESGVQGLWIIRAAISATVLAVIAAVGFSVLEVGGAWIGGVVLAVGLAVGVAHSVLRYRVWTFQVRSDSLHLERGVLTRVRTVAPHVRIQHVDTRRGPLERSLGLATTVVYTAGSRGADVSIPGLTPERADDLQARLKQLAIAAEGEDAV
jgi:membrane protein YdbS with pleckstrin-like domain